MLMWNGVKSFLKVQVDYININGTNCTMLNLACYLDPGLRETSISISISIKLWTITQIK